MDVDSPSTQPVTVTSHETQIAIREKKRQEFTQWREELRKLVGNVPWEFRGLHGGLTRFGEELDRDIERIHDEHRSIEEHYKSLLETFNEEWDHAKKSIEEPFFIYSDQLSAKEEREILYWPVDALVDALQTLQQASETEINHPEVSFKKNLNSLRERLEERIETGYQLKAILNGMVEKLENVSKRVDEFEKLMEQ
ncbi:hypothetical protein J3F84DRAFT_402612 [Trichoderma pleuroticola]